VNPTPSSWLLRPFPRPDAQATLVCFPFAGGNVSAFSPWNRFLDDRIELFIANLPGRGQRRLEPPESQLAVVVGALAEAVAALPDRKTVLMGHSLGATIAFEVARRLRGDQQRLPDHLVLSSRRGPRMLDTRTPSHHLSDDAFIAAISERYGGIPEVILQEPALLALFLPALRADITLYERYNYHPQPPLPVPISAWGGRADPALSPAALEFWREETSAAFSTRWYPGGHFYLQPERAAVLRELQALL
jgi:medium-chain acyl-[acyl-carrier-protein] hydrolase